MSTFTVTITLASAVDAGAVEARRLSRRRTLRAASERHINYMPKLTEPGNEKSGFYREQVPGLTLLGDLGGPIRGAWWTGDRCFVVAGSGFFELHSDYSFTQRGTLLTMTGRVDMAQGLLSLVVVDGPYGYALELGTSLFGRIADPDFYGSDRVMFLDGKFLFQRPDTQQFYWSTGVDGATQYDALDFASAESAPDKLTGLIVDHREIWLMGTTGGEVWTPAPALDQVYARSNGASIEVGCAAQHSLQQVDNSVAWVGTDRKGQGLVWLAGGSNGYTPTRISSNEMEEVLAKIDDLSGATAFVYQDAGQTFYCLNVPGAETTWIWDASTRKWHERAEHTAGLLSPWRVTEHVFAFGVHIMGGADGKLYELDPYEYTLAGDAMYRQWTTPHAAIPDRKRVFFDSLRLDATVGETDSGLDPQIEMRYSNDGGNTWGAWAARSTGKIGEFNKVLKWDRLGQGRDRVWEFRTTANAKVSLIGIAVDAKKGT